MRNLKLKYSLAHYFLPFLVAFVLLLPISGIFSISIAQASPLGTSSRATTLREITSLQPAKAMHKECEQGAKNPDGTTRSYQDYALCLSYELDRASQAYKEKKYDETLQAISDAYFEWYENSLEPASMILSGNRKVKMEGRFTRLKLALRANPEDESILPRINTIKVAVARDAMVLDGVLPDQSPESAGKALFAGAKKTASSTTLNWVDFFTAFTLLLREGLEALLVVVAIVLYLVKSGNRQLVKHVYYGVVAAVALSFVLAYLMQSLVGGAGQASELLEGLTMFLAVAVLFYVSNWMLSKSSGENWSRYIQSMVKTSISERTGKVLVAAAFLAVIREGAELVLFYTASFAGGGHNSFYIAAGFGAGVAVLAIIFLIFRYGAIHLPVRAIFFGTSILLFIMCISFVGKGVQELKEANVILGSTNLPWMHYYLPDLGIYPQAETLLPQIILFIASVWIILSHTLAGRKARRAEKLTTAKAEHISAEAAEKTGCDCADEKTLPNNSGANSAESENH
ncbi:FTR1 family iron permease [Actinomycetaceae bacterium TAE3-ERU4]|nr:FTR1 family iron permease [Actinomycetaceae bacterium TAE3-ERU4]